MAKRLAVPKQLEHLLEKRERDRRSPNGKNLAGPERRRTERRSADRGKKK
jgi:hypothetical protein